jgi:hypothetical protein
MRFKNVNKILQKKNCGGIKSDLKVLVALFLCIHAYVLFKDYTYFSLSFNKDFENLGEFSKIDNSAYNASLAWLSPPHKPRFHFHFNIENLLCNKKQGTS